MIIQVYDGNNSKEYNLEQFKKSTITFGRNMDQDIILISDCTSRCHGCFYGDETGWYVVDNDSTNGILHNGNPVRNAKLAKGDTVILSKNNQENAVRIFVREDAIVSSDNVSVYVASSKAGSKKNYVGLVIAILAIVIIGIAIFAIVSKRADDKQNNDTESATESKITTEDETQSITDKTTETTTENTTEASIEITTETTEATTEVITTEVTTATTTEVTTEATTEAMACMTQEQALQAVKNYCYATNPTLHDMEGQYYFYWNVDDLIGEEYKVTYRSYTAAFTYYYVNIYSGYVHATEYVPGIVNEETPTDETFNAWDYVY